MSVLKFAMMGAAVVAFMVSPAMAKDGNGHGKDRGHSEYEVETHRSSGHSSGYSSGYSGGYSSHDGMTRIRIGDDDRSVLHRYLEDNYKHNCPPGLAKKHNGCLPLGQAKKRYMVGYRLPDDVRYDYVPHEVLSHLRPAPYGYRYVRVDTDVLLIGEATKDVIDAVTLLSAVGRQ